MRCEEIYDIAAAKLGYSKQKFLKELPVSRPRPAPEGILATGPTSARPKPAVT
ncbi:hypothetical protein MAPG_03477 [Magnaporthiopsis poae ATCC 64411]|uniref:Uncharacterized protein n=1 Tax=Magnaporthiopsis poae (strain ATCC 64411 / 73-15) TaxID=644358 RepID=A0A0C4DU44_MAGP6|nr:hypothetical protein MAPG_03477 [Magnaporthiopsis poae ATCC 64411]